MQINEKEMVVKGLECCRDCLDMGCEVSCYSEDCPYKGKWNCIPELCSDALNLLKEQEGYVSVPFSWLVKFCTHIDFKEPVTDEERELLWKQKLKQQFGIDLEGES